MLDVNYKSQEEAEAEDDDGLAFWTDPKCPFCWSGIPDVVLIHDEFQAECCEELFFAAENSEIPDSIFSISKSEQEAIQKWQATVEIMSHELA